MADKIKVKVGDVELEGELKETNCAEVVKELLPLEKEYQTWGNEFYFPIAVNMELDETATSEVEVGTIGYWPPGQAVALFFGRTPDSDGDKPVAASDVNVIGFVEKAERLKSVREVGKITIREG